MSGERHFVDSLANIAAPMVGQSDLPFRKLVRRYNTTSAFTQMLLPERLLNDQEYLEFHLRGLGDTDDRPIVVQLCGNDPELVVKAARKVQSQCDAIGITIYSWTSYHFGLIVVSILNRPQSRLSSRSSS